MKDSKKKPIDPSEHDKLAEESKDAVQRARELFMEIKRVESAESDILSDGRDESIGAPGST